MLNPGTPRILVCFCLQMYPKDSEQLKQRVVTMLIVMKLKIPHCCPVRKVAYDWRKSEPEKLNECQSQGRVSRKWGGAVGEGRDWLLVVHPRAQGLGHCGYSLASPNLLQGPDDSERLALA